MKKPNILIFNPDEMRADILGCLGNRAKVTPNMDRIVKEDAIAFSNAFCQNPVCVPSRCSFLTGLYPHVFGHRTMEHPISEVKPMFQELRENGYYVWMNNRNDFVKNSDVDAINANGDTVYYPRGPMVRCHSADEKKHPNWTSRSFMVGVIPEETKDLPDRDADAVRGLIKFLKHRPQNKPFCAFLGLFNPHPPYGVEKKYYDRVNPALISERIPTPEEWGKVPSMIKHIHDEAQLTMTEDDWKEMQRIYYAMCLKVDEYFGKIVKILKDENIYDDTDIYILSDHGDFVGNYGLPEKNQNTFQDCLTKVPLIIKPNKSISTEPGVNDSLVELVDFYATVLDLAGIRPTHSHFGYSLKMILEDKKKSYRSYVFCEGGRLDNEEHCMEKAPFMLDCYVPRLGGQQLEPCHTKATMIRSKKYKYVKRLYETDEFYNLEEDPQEYHNEIDNLRYKDIINEMKLEMLDWYQKTCDIVPLEADGRVGSAPMTLIEEYVSENKKERMKERAIAGGYTLREFEDMCKNESIVN